MPSEIVMPKLGLTMTEGTLQEWKVQPGETFVKGQALFAVETEKIVNEIEADFGGTMASHVVQVGETVPVGAVVALVSTRDGNRSRPKPERICATPYARTLAEGRGVSLAQVVPSEDGGTIRARDVDRFCEAQRLQRSSVAVRSPVERIKPTSAQKAMAKRLEAVKHGTPHFYLATEADVTGLLDLRRGLNLPVKVTLTHCLLAAIGSALKAFPNINRVWEKGEILQFSSCNISVAVETDHGLYVPVVVDVDAKTLGELAKTANAAIEKARAGRLTAGDMAMSAITLSNAGMHDVTWLTPIINLGQSSIIGVASVRDVFRPDGAKNPVLRKALGMAFSGDHRIHTGVEGLQFLNRVKSLLENPGMLLGDPGTP